MSALLGDRSRRQIHETAPIVRLAEEGHRVVGVVAGDGLRDWRQVIAGVQRVLDIRRIRLHQRAM